MEFLRRMLMAARPEHVAHGGYCRGGDGAGTGSGCIDDEVGEGGGWTRFVSVAAGILIVIADWGGVLDVAGGGDGDECG